MSALEKDDSNRHGEAREKFYIAFYIALFVGVLALALAVKLLV